VQDLQTAKDELSAEHKSELESALKSVHAAADAKLHEVEAKVASLEAELKEAQEATAKAKAAAAASAVAAASGPVAIGGGFSIDQVKQTMNKMYGKLRTEFDEEDSYESDVILAKLLAVIKSTTLEITGVVRKTKKKKKKSL